MANEFKIIKLEAIDLTVLDCDKITDPHMTKFEFSRLIACRALQLNNDDDPLVDTEGETDPLEIARRELYELVLRLVIQRNLPDGRTEWLKMSELYISD
uniref:RNA polymerase subunit 6 n=1 Tax=Marseillevirus LCMAC101 TaxID=2506602 RepID=A0A481YU54_9VIRU|nr:MAG: RNA polymerase subunit 6 [Marseillevirus LCMAC101]